MAPCRECLILLIQVWLNVTMSFSKAPDAVASSRYQTSTSFVFIHFDFIS